MSRSRIWSGLAENRSMNPTEGQEPHPSHVGKRDGVRSCELTGKGAPHRHIFHSFCRLAIEFFALCDWWDDFHR